MKVEITVDEKSLPLNKFTQDIIANVSASLAESLHGVNPDWTSLVIKVNRD